MSHEVQEVEMKDEFKVCPACGYKDGFHSMFKKEGEVTKWLFICPSCPVKLQPSKTSFSYGLSGN